MNAASRIEVEFLDRELDLSQTFLDVAQVDADDQANAANARAKAQQGFDTVLSCIEMIRDERERNRLMSRLGQLKARLDDL